MQSKEAVENARALDAGDELAAFRGEFVVDDPELIYLDGNSLGRLPRRTAALMQELIGSQWGRRLVRGWPESWIDLPKRVGGKIARLIGAQPDEVIVCDSTSVNLYKLVSAALQCRPGRSRIVTDSSNFPSDVYLLQGCAEAAGRKLVVVEPWEIQHALNEDTALLALSHVAFKSGAIQPMADLTEAAQSVGALTLWDLCHSVGALPVDLGACNADLAVGCTYKYLNGGPGSPAFLYVLKKLQDELRNPIWGWFGHRDAFAFSLDYAPAEGMRSFLAGTPPILSLAAVEPGVDLILETGIERLRRKSIAQTEFLIELFDEFLAPVGFVLQSPRDAASRGSHVAVGHPDGFRIDQALIELMNVVPDFRHPDTIRFGVTPAYTTFEDLARAVLLTRQVVDERLYERFSPARSEVT